MKVGFYEIGMIEDNLLDYAVIGAVYDGKWIYVKHKERDTWEIPGGTREDESIEKTASRELVEETGALDYTIYPIMEYEVIRADIRSYGRLYYAEVKSIDALSAESEMEEIALFNHMPKNLTYPEIQPHLFKVIERFHHEMKSKML